MTRNEEGTGEQRGEKLPGDIAYMRTLIVNVVFVGDSQSDDWVLVDTGIHTFADQIVNEAERRFGTSKPRAIVLTHGHFDHVGSLPALLKAWEDVPVYAHERELPYLTGRADYLEGDPSVGGGLMAGIAPLYPHKGIHLGDRVKPLPADGTIPHMPGWAALHTPGHTEGHTALFREADRVLIAGDAFITVKQESALAVFLQREEIHGPPAYFTPNWEAAWASVRKLEQLQPLAAITGHGVPMFGEKLRQGLATLARDFDKMAIPEQGRYVPAD